MANGFDQNAESGPSSKGQEPCDSPEDVVRRLLQAEAEIDPPAGPAPHPETAPANTPDKAPKQQSRFGKLTAAPRQAVSETCAKARSAVLSYRPTPRHAALALLTIIVLIMPWLIPVLALLGVAIALISYLSIGHDRTVELISAGYGRQVQHNPQGTGAVRSRAARLSAGLSRWLGFLPARWTSGLYLPDFEKTDEQSELLNGDPFERLSEESRNR